MEEGSLGQVSYFTGNMTCLHAGAPVLYKCINCSLSLNSVRLNLSTVSMYALAHFFFAISARSLALPDREISRQPSITFRSGCDQVHGGRPQRSAIHECSYGQGG